MAVETLACTINSLGSWTNVGGANATVSVAKPDDEDATYITILAGIDTACLYDVANSALGSETITSVSVRFREKTLISTDNSCSVQMSDNAFVNNLSTSPLITTSYADYLLTSATKPSGGAWTVAAVNSLQVKLFGADVSVLRCTTLTAEVTYVSGGVHGLLTLGCG